MPRARRGAASRPERQASAAVPARPSDPDTPLIRRAWRALTVFLLACVALLGSHGTAQAQTELWSETLTVGSFTNSFGTFYAWNDAGTYTGSALVDEDFDYGGDTYKLSDVYVARGMSPRVAFPHSAGCTARSQIGRLSSACTQNADAFRSVWAVCTQSSMQSPPNGSRILPGARTPSGLHVHELLVRICGLALSIIPSFQMESPENPVRFTIVDHKYIGGYDVANAE